MNLKRPSGGRKRNSYPAENEETGGAKKGVPLLSLEVGKFETAKADRKKKQNWASSPTNTD